MKMRSRLIAIKNVRRFSGLKIAPFSRLDQSFKKRFVSGCFSSSNDPIGDQESRKGKVQPSINTGQLNFRKFYFLLVPYEMIFGFSESVDLEVKDRFHFREYIHIF